MYTYIATLQFTIIDFYGEDHMSYTPQVLNFTDENIWLARNKVLLYLAEKEWHTEFLCYYNVNLKLLAHQSMEEVDLGTWILRFSGMELWNIDWEKEMDIFERLGVMQGHYRTFYKLTQELYGQPVEQGKYVFLIGQLAQFGQLHKELQRYCDMYIGLAYMRMKHFKQAFEFLRRYNEVEIKELMYRCAFQIKFEILDAMDIYHELYNDH